MILAIDPGSEKCGIAILNNNASTQLRKIIPRQEIISAIKTLLSQYNISKIVIGKGHFGKEIEKEITQIYDRINIIFVDEKHSTLLARQKYWESNPPKGFWKLIPTAWRVPPVPIDDFAAQILGERYFKG